MSAYYNENDPYAAAWLRELVKQHLIADGEVDDRSIKQVQPSDLRGFAQCHFFAGIGGWSYALRLAGWADAEPVWTGSCPCQPWSVAGEDQGYDDERHLWPYFSRLARECRPATILGEQVTNAIRWGWLDDALIELEAEGYACAAAVLPALCVDADHQRNRIFFVADAGGEGRQGLIKNDSVPCSTAAPLAVNGNSLVRARSALAGDYSDLLPCNGLSVQLERNALKGYGNAIVPEVAQVFIEAYMSATGGLKKVEFERA